MRSHKKTIPPVLLLAALLIAGEGLLTAWAGGKPVSNNLTNKGIEPPFPSDWVGQWKGTCNAITNNGVKNSFPMQLHIEPLEDKNRYTWKIIYGEGKTQQIRLYELVVVDAEKGHYRIDEKNSIVIDSYLFGDSLCSQFDVSGAMLTVRYTLHRGNLIFDLVSTRSDQPIETGGEGAIPKVRSYPVNATQLAVLKRSR